jgi:hypothetical protein
LNVFAFFSTYAFLAFFCLLLQIPNIPCSSIALKEKVQLVVAGEVYDRSLLLVWCALAVDRWARDTENNKAKRERDRQRQRQKMEDPRKISLVTMQVMILTCLSLLLLFHYATHKG